MKHHERRELVNTLTKIAREYGQTQQLRERIAFEAWMIGHNWMPHHVQWTGSIYGPAYRSATEDGLFIDPEAVRTRMMWAAWRDRAALSKQQSVKIPANTQQSQQ